LLDQTAVFEANGAGVLAMALLEYTAAFEEKVATEDTFPMCVDKPRIAFDAYTDLFDPKTEVLDPKTEVFEEKVATEDTFPMFVDNPRIAFEA
jgi:hypothetical protein